MRQSQMYSQEKQMKLFKKIVASIILLLTCTIIIVWVTGGSSSKGIPFQYDELPALGDRNAPVKVVEVSDFKCPYCKTFSTSILPQLEEQFIDQGKVSFYYFNQAFVGEDSLTAAVAAHSVFKQNQEAFWQYTDALYERQPSPREAWATESYLIEVARELELPVDIALLEQDLVNRVYEKEINEQIQFAAKHNINSVPTLLINGKRYSGDMTVEAVTKVIQAALK